MLVAYCAKCASPKRHEAGASTGSLLVHESRLGSSVADAESESLNVSARDMLFAQTAINYFFARTPTERMVESEQETKI